MYRALPFSRQAIFHVRSGLARTARRRLATEATEASSHPAPAPKKKSVVRRILFYTTAAIGTFYVGSAFIAFHSSTYYDFFSERVPLGNSFLEFAESHDWDMLTAKDVLEAPQNASNYVQRLFSRDTGTTKSEKPQDSTTNAYKESKQRAHSIVQSLKTTVEKVEEDITKGGSKAVAIARHRADQFSTEVEDLVRKAEAALAGPVKTEQAAETPSQSASPLETAESKPPKGKTVYDGPIPVEFEPPPGFSRPPNPAPDPRPFKEPAPPPLPLVAAAISELTASEPILVQLATTIDDLASYLNDRPSTASKARNVIETAKLDLSELASRIDKVREDERAQLEQKMDEQTREYTLKLLELEMEAQDKLDNQEEGFRKLIDEERAMIVQSYRQKLEQELKTQTELINERLKEEVVAQGIELQRRWIRDIKIHVEQERGGRLAKLDELAANLKRLERLALDNSSYLDENIRVHALWSALRALNHVVESPIRRPFREELRVLRHVAAAREDPVVATALETLDASDIPDIGVEPFADLASWFSTSVAPRLSSVALVPDQNAGVLSHLASHLLSSFKFQRHGLVEGSDVLSVIARAEYYLNEKDLDGAARELNQLKGTAKVLLSDWLDAARRRLEVLQALQVVETQATLASLLVL